MKCRRARHVHLVKPGKMQHGGAHADNCVGAHGLCMHDQPVQRVMTRFIEHIAEFFDLAAHQRL